MNVEINPKPRELSNEVLREVKALVVRECANYQRNGPFEASHYCWMKEKSNNGICVYFNQREARCSYFENVVLPLDEDLREEYYQGEERDGRKIEDRPTNFGKGDGQVIRDFEADLAKTPKFRGALAKHRRAGILPRPALHGLASKEQVEDQ